MNSKLSKMFVGWSGVYAEGGIPIGIKCED